jgi:hypothetical protein
MPTTGAGLASTAVTARQARLSPAGTALNRRRVAPLTASGCLARDLAAAGTQKPRPCRAQSAPYGSINLPAPWLCD